MYLTLINTPYTIMLIFTCCLLLEVWLKFAGHTFQLRVLTFPFPPKFSEKSLPAFNGLGHEKEFK
jgi:hypothetical protein